MSARSLGRWAWLQLLGDGCVLLAHLFPGYLPAVLPCHCILLWGVFPRLAFSSHAIRALSRLGTTDGPLPVVDMIVGRFFIIVQGRSL